jgi:hypothetical protein
MSDRAPVHWPVWLALGGLALVPHALADPAYGYFRDELYYLACARHLAWGYVDHPPLSIFVLALVRATAGESLLAIRALPALLGGAAVVVTCWLAREFGGRPWAQLLAGAATLSAPIFLAQSDYYSLNSLDLLLWPLLLAVLVRLARTDNARLWLPFGVVAGLVLLNKWTGLVLLAAIGVGVVLSPLRRHLRRGRFYLGAGIAVALISPNVIWQVHHGWPTVEFIANAKTLKMVSASPLEFVAGQILLLNPLASPLWLSGLFFLLLSRRLRPFRFLGLTYLALVLQFLITGGKSYYSAPIYPILLAAGGVAFEAWFAAPRWRWVNPLAVMLMAASGVALLPLAVPVLSPPTLARYTAWLPVQAPQDERSAAGALPTHLADRLGWPEQVAALAATYRQLPAEDRERCAILTQNYGQAGAVDRLGPALGLPTAICAHNSYWLWGPRDYDGACVIVLGEKADDMHEFFEDVREVGRVQSPYARSFESDLPVLLCRRIKAPLPDLWRQAKLYR